MTNTPATNWTLAPTPGFVDFGSQGQGWARRAFVGPGDAVPGWIAATAEDYVGCSVAFKEVPITQQIIGHVAPSIAGRMTNPGREASSILSGG
jgi:hypothetical protein